VIDLATNQPLDFEFSRFDLDESPPRLLLLANDKELSQQLTDIVIRANQANVATKDSEVFSFGCVDPCTTTVPTSINFPDFIETSVKSETPGSFGFSEVTDSVSLEFTDNFGDGTGYDICGPREYSVFEIIDGVETIVDFVEIIDFNAPNYEIEVKT
jgi:hypothetical protein